MDLLDFFWNVSQERQIDELRTRIDRERLERDLARGELPTLKQLGDENHELKLRLALLLRLLISKGVMTAQEYAALLTEARPSL